jgi:hypothetical protein
MIFPNREPVGHPITPNQFDKTIVDFGYHQKTIAKKQGFNFAKAKFFKSTPEGEGQNSCHTMNTCRKETETKHKNPIICRGEVGCRSSSS